MKLPKTIVDGMRAYPAFYQRVWRACAQVPKGQVRSYGWLAKKIGSPKAARAVGQALAKNPFAPTVPCHRIVSSSGALTGYSATGGLQAKRRLLIKEGCVLKAAS